MTFSENPNFVELKGQTLKDNVLQSMQVDWGASTNIENAFDLILKVAIDNKLKEEDLPKALIIISDMEFNQAQDEERQTYFDKMSLKYSKFGYGLPKVVFWNVNARTNTFHADVKTKEVQFISGQSASAFKSLIKGTEFTAYELMIETLSDEMYDSVCIK
jgi:hypothetical protein